MLLLRRSLWRPPSVVRGRMWGWNSVEMRFSGGRMECPARARPAADGTVRCPKAKQLIDCGRLHPHVPVRAAISGLIDAAADDRLFEPFAIHLLRLDPFCDRIEEFVALPEAVMRLGKLKTFPHERFAVDVLVVDLVGADALLVGTVRNHQAVERVDDDVEVAV